MTSSIRSKQSFSEAINKASKGLRIYGTVIEILGSKATVRLNGGARLSGLIVTGGTVSLGEKVLVEWDGSEPYVRATAQASASSSVSRVSLSSHSTGTEPDIFARGGWTIDLNGVISTDKTRIEPGGIIILGDADPSDNVVVLDGEDITYRIWAGALLPASAPFKVTKEGALTASNANISGTIHAALGDIGGWNIGTYTITADSGSVGLNSEVGGDNWRIWAGSATPGSAPFRVNANGDVWLESATIDQDLQSSNFLSGYSGWKIAQDGSAEFNNVVVRGELLTTIFKYNEIAAVAGDLGVFKGGGKLTASMTTVASPTTFTMYYEGSTLTVNDIVRIKDGFYDNWCIVKTVVSSTECTLELKYGTPTTFAEGITVVNYGPSGAGGILLTANQTNAPYMDIFTHAGEPWSTTTPKTRVGKLDTSLDATLLPTGYGLYSDNAYLKGKLVSGYFSMDPSNGLKITAADTYYPERAINIVYGSTTVGQIKQKVDTGAVVNEMTISVEPYTNRHSSIDMSCTSPGSSYASTYSLSVSQNLVGAMYLEIQKSSTNHYAKLTGGGLMVGSLTNYTIAEGSIDMSGNLRLAGGIYVGSATGTVLDNGILATGDIRTSGGLSVGSTSNDPSGGHLYTVYDIRIGGGLYVGGLDVDPVTGQITATSHITATAGNITTSSGTVTGATVNAASTLQKYGTAGLIFVPASSPFFAVDTVANTWDGGGSRGAGGYYIRLSTNGIPSTARAVAIRLAGYWTTANNGYYCCAETYGETNPALVIRSAADGMYADGCGIVLTPAGVYFDLRVAGATMNGPVCQIVGWYI